MFVEHLDVEADAFFGGEGVHVAADGIDLTGDLLGSAVLGAFEDHVLDEMRDAVRLRRLIAGTGLEPNADGSRADVLHLLGDYGEAVGQHLTTNIADFFYHVRASRTPLEGTVLFLHIWRGRVVVARIRRLVI